MQSPPAHKLVGEGNSVLNACVLTAMVPAATDMVAAAGALDRAFSQVVGEMVAWTQKANRSGPT